MRRRSPGFTRRPKRMAMERAYHQHRLRERHPDWSEETVKAEAEASLERTLPKDPKTLREYLRTSPVSVAPNRRRINELVEVAALRRLDAGQALETRLRSCGDGRPSDRLLAIATFLRNIFEVGRPEVWRYLQGFHTDHRLLHWAYDWPVARGGVRNPANIYRTMKAALDRRTDEYTVMLNIAAIRELRERLGESNIGRWLTLDGTDIPAAREQRQYDANFPGEEAFLRDGLEDANYTVHVNGSFVRKAWRGPRLIILIDIVTSLPLAWVVKQGSRPEYEALQELLELVFSYWPDWAPESITADGHFDNEKTHRLCEEQYGIHPVFARGNPVSPSYVGHATDGTPVCPHHPDQVDEMKLVQSEHFIDAAARHQLGLTPGEPADLGRAAFRWVCTAATDDHGRSRQCGYRKRTMWKTNPRLYTYFAKRGTHHNRMALRHALEKRRNAAESVNSWLKGQGVGLPGQSAPRWVSTDRQMRWLLGGTLLGYMLRRLAHATGVYDQTHAEAESKGLLKATVPTQADLREVACRLRKAAGRAQLAKDLLTAGLLRKDSAIAHGLSESLNGHSGV